MDRLTYPDIARIFGTGLISTGVGLLLFVVVTVTWGDPFTRLSASGEQRKLEKILDASLPTAGQLQGSAALDSQLTLRAATLAKKQTPLGQVAGRLRIPELGKQWGFVNGARNGTSDLTKGPGLYKETPFPGAGRPIAIAGHRTTYGAPFLNIDRLKPGHTIILQMRYGTFTYTVTRQRIINPDDWSILRPGELEQVPARRAAVTRSGRCFGQTCEHLVLTACHPKYSAAKRLAVFARLTGVQLTKGSAAA